MRHALDLIGIHDSRVDVARETPTREFADHAADWTDPITRRQFMTIMGASLALASSAGCTCASQTKDRSLRRKPEQETPGKPLFFATAMPLAGSAIGLLVESHDGRPTKVEGNPQHPASRGRPTPLPRRPS